MEDYTNQKRAGKGREKQKTCKGTAQESLSFSQASLKLKLFFIHGTLINIYVYIFICIRIYRDMHRHARTPSQTLSLP